MGKKRATDKVVRMVEKDTPVAFTSSDMDVGGVPACPFEDKADINCSWPLCGCHDDEDSK